MKRLLWYPCIFIICAIGSAIAQHPDAGTVEFSFLNIQSDARSVGMGGASVAIPNDLFGVFSNPAALAYIDNIQLQFGFRPVFMDVWGGPLAAAYRYDKYGVFGLNLFGITAGDIEEVIKGNSTDPVVTGRVAHSYYMTGGASWAKIVHENLSVGATLKGIYKRLGIGSEYYSSDGVAIDAGIQYRLLNDRLIYGLAMRNAGFVRSTYTSEGERPPIPVTIEGGVSFVPRAVPILRLTFDVNKRSGDYLNIEPALELQVHRKVFQVRLGATASAKDTEAFIGKLRGEEDENYRKTNMLLLAGGAGFNTEINKSKLFVDLGLAFGVDHTISPVISVLYQF